MNISFMLADVISFQLYSLAYVCLNELGERICPAYLSRSFSRILAQNSLRHIRFHDLRHSSATLLLAHGVPLKQIQEWLGHSDFSTTANIYAHLDVKSKERSAAVMEEALRLDDTAGKHSPKGSLRDEIPQAGLGGSPTSPSKA